MKIIAYLYSDPICEASSSPTIWGWEVDQIYQDFDERRPQLQALVQACQNQPADYLLLRRLEELGNSVGEVTKCLAQLEVLGIHVLAIEQDYSSPQPNFISTSEIEELSNFEPVNSKANSLQLLELLETVQAHQRSRRIRQGHARNRLKALPPPGKAPYGYRRGKDRYAIDRSAAPVVKDFFEHFLLYGSLREAVRHLEKKHAKKISVSTGRRWLTNPVYRGDLIYQNNQVLTGTHMPIVSREEAAQVDRLLRRNRSLAPRTASASRSLAGLVVCGMCQSPLIVSRVTTPRRAQEYLYLRPSTCPHNSKCSSITYQEVLDQTIQRICQDLPQAVAGVNMPVMNRIKEGIEVAIANKQQVLDQLSKLVDSEILDQPTAELRTYNLRTEISELKAKLAQLPPVNLKEIAQAISIPQFWLDLSESERRFYFREFIQRIEIIRQETKWSLSLVFIF
jgi:DNA invertase Pin-like site-specific DNA recombinase